VPLDRLFLPADAIVFDSDGVLVDSDASVDRAWRRWSAARGLDAEHVIDVAHGHRSRETVDRFVAEADRPAAQEEIDRLELEDAATVTAVPGALALVRSIPAGRWAVVTSGVRVLAMARLDAAGMPLPEVVITADDVVHGKPDPEGYAAAMRRLGVDPARTIVLEDAPGGVRAALAAGAGAVVGVGMRAVATPAVAVVRDLRALAWDGVGLRVDPEARLR
jgi:sugar-phosphatase